MYTEDDLTAVSRQEKKRWLLMLLPVLPLLALVAFAAVQRIEPLAVGASIALGAVLIGGWGLLIRPIHVYRKYLDAMLHGPNHLVSGEFIAFDPDESLVDDVRCRSLRVTCVDDEDKPYERLFYFDAEKPLPALQPGQRVEIRYHDRQVVSIG